MSNLIPAVRGMRDVLGEETSAWRYVADQVALACSAYGYDEIKTPILEREELFVRPVGAQTDIVAKELYSFADRDRAKTVLCMRPEATVPALRALAAAGKLDKGITRAWYLGPMFRRERPQRGRYRQFHQFGAEAVGSASAQLDAEMILLCARIWQVLGIADKLELQVNNLGSLAERTSYRTRLQDYLRTHKDELDDDARERIESNPLRILDSKIESTLAVVAQAPSLAEDLGEKSQKHFAHALDIVHGCGLKTEFNPRLVRGLDYYNLTVFEWVARDDERRQNAIAGGGRYDSLASVIGGPDVAGVGFAAGLERVLALTQAAAADQPDVFLGVYANAADAIKITMIAERLRDADLSVVADVARSDKISALFRRADSSNAKLAVVIGPREAAAGTALIKPLRSEQPQQEAELDKLAEAVRATIEHTPS